MDQAKLARARRQQKAGGGSGGGDNGAGGGLVTPDVDPWATEARLVAQLGRLATAQVQIGITDHELRTLGRQRSVPEHGLP